MSDLSEEEDSMEEDDSGEDEESSEEEESAGESEGGSDSESADEENQSGTNESFIENVQPPELSSSSDEGTERDRCPICLNRFIGQDLGIPENCEHIFCFECIKEWGSNINTCPIDRNEFDFVHVKRSPDGKTLKKVRVRVRSKEPEEGTVAEENTLCEVCRMGDREHRLLLCDACDLAYHCDCLDPPLFHIPIEEWFCPPCASIMTQRGEGALPSTSRARRVIPRTRASESVRVRVQNRRTYPSTSPRTASTQRPKKRKRRTYRRCIRKVVNLARTKAAGSSGKGGKTGRATAVMVTYRKKYKRRKRRKTKKTSRKTRLPTASAESNLQSAKERIAKRLGLCKGRTGTAIPDVRSKAGPSSQGTSSDRSHSLFGARDQLMDFSENFNEYAAIPSTSASTPRNIPRRSETIAAPSNLLDSILAGQELLHAKSDNVVIRNDGSLIRKEGEKKKAAKETSNTSKSVVRVGLCKPDTSKHATPDKSNSLSLLHGALTKRKSTESHSKLQQKPGTSSHNSTKDVFKKPLKIKKEKDKDGSSRHSSLSTSPVISSKSHFKTDKRASLKDRSSTLNNNSTTNSSEPYFASKSKRSNLSDNKKQSEKSKKDISSNTQDSVPDHRLDILQKRASFLEKFNTKPTVSAINHLSGYSSGNQQSSLSDEINSLAAPKINEIKIKDEPLSSSDEEECSESLIGQANKFLSRTFKTEFQSSESLIGNCGTDQFSSTTLNASITMKSSELGVLKPNFIKKEPVSSDEESIGPMSDNHELCGFRVQIKEEPDASAEDALNNLPFTKAAESFEDLPCTQAAQCFEDLPCTQAVEGFEDLPCTQAAEPFEDLPCTQAAEHFEDLPCTQAAEPFEDLPCTQAVEPFEDLPCTQAAERFENLPCTQAAERFEDLPCTQAVEPFEDLPCTQAAERFEDLPCTQAAERFEDLPCTQAVDPFEDLPCTQVANIFPKETVFKVPKSKLPLNDHPRHTSEPSIPHKHNLIKKAPISSNKESISPMSDNNELFGFRVQIKEEPDASSEHALNNLSLTKATESYEDLPFTQAAESFEDLPCTQAVEYFEDLPCTQAAETFEDLPCTQAAESFEDLPCTQAVDPFEDLPCTQAVEYFEDLPCTQAAEPFEDLPCTQAAESFEDLPCTQAVNPFEDLPCTQAAEPFKDLPCTQVANVFPNEAVFKVPKSNLPLNGPPRHTSEPSIPHKLSSNHSKLKNSKAVAEYSDLPATQLPTQEMPHVSAREISLSKESGTINSIPDSKQENKTDNSLLNTQLSEDEGLLEAKKAIALLRSECNKVKTPPKVMGVHRNLPQVITSVPVRRPLIPKPVNKVTFSFGQVKQHFNLEEPQNNNLSDTETSSKLSSQFKSVIKTKLHLSSDSNSEHLSKLRPINKSTTVPSNNIHASLPEINSKDQAVDCKSKKMSNNLLGTLSDSKLIKSSLNKETLQDVSNIEINAVNKPTQSLYRSKEQFQPPSNIPHTLLQTDCLASCHIKKEPLDINADIITQNHCTAKKVDGHIGESNLARALRIKREMNAEVLQQNAYKESVSKVPGLGNIAEGSTMLRRLSVKQEMNLEVMRENLLQASFENSRHKDETNKSSSAANSAKDKETMSVRIKIEKDDKLHINKCLEKEKSICKEKDCKADAKYIKKEKCTKTKSYSIDKTLHKSDTCNKEVKKESNSEKRYKHIENDKCRETNPQSKNKDNYNKRNSDKYTETDDDHSNFERKSKFQEKKRRYSKERTSDGNKRKVDEDHHSSNKINNKHALKDRDHSGNDSDRKTKCVVKDSTGRNSDMKSDCVDKKKRDCKISIPDSRNKQVGKNRHCSVESNSYSKKKNTEKDVQDNMKRSPASNSVHAEKDINTIKKSNVDRKNKQLENYEHDSNEKSGDTKKKHGDKDKHDSKDRNSYNKDKHGKKDKHSSRVNNYDREHKHTESDKHCHKERVSDLRLKHSEKDHYDVKESKSERNSKPILKDNKDRYSDKNAEKDKHNKNCDGKKYTEKDKQTEGSESDKNNKHTEKDKFSNKKRDFISKHDEKETHKNRNRKELTENFENKRHCKENNQTKKVEEMPGKLGKKSGTSDQFKDEIKIKKEATSIENRKRSFEATSIDFHSDKSNHENKRRKISTEVNKQNPSTTSKSCTSPDSTSGPDTSERLSAFGSSKHEETLLDARIRKMMSHDDYETGSSKKRRHESMCSEDTSGCFSDISQLSNELLLKAEVISFNSPKMEKVEELKQSAPSLKSSSKVQKSNQDLKEEIATQIKLILKPFFTVGVVNKEDYKDIMRKAVPKVFLNCGSCVNPDKIKKLVLGYVAKLKNS